MLRPQEMATMNHQQMTFCGIDESISHNMKNKITKLRLTWDIRRTSNTRNDETKAHTTEPEFYSFPNEIQDCQLCSKGLEVIYRVISIAEWKQHDEIKESINHLSEYDMVATDRPHPYSSMMFIVYIVLSINMGWANTIDWLDESNEIPWALFFFSSFLDTLARRR